MANVLSAMWSLVAKGIAYGLVGMLAVWVVGADAISDAIPDIPFCLRQVDMLRFKEGVSVTFTPEVNRILEQAEFTFQAHGYSCICTSGTDGNHMPTSKHYLAQAVDLRSKHVAQDALPKIVQELQERLGKDFDVVLEGDHIHAEYDTHGT